MHKVTLPDGTRVQDGWIKWLRVLAYFLMGLAGVFCLLSPFLTLIYTDLAVVMSWFLVAGGTLSFVGALGERWWGEYTGLPLLSSSFAVFAVISFAGSYGQAPFLASANLCLLASISAGLMARWRDVRVIYLLAVHLSKRELPR
jgi:hypothetical protein